MIVKVYKVEVSVQYEEIYWRLPIDYIKRELLTPSCLFLIWYIHPTTDVFRKV